MNFLYKFIRELGRKGGIEINRLSSETNSSLQLVKALKYFDIGTVVDVGANAGQFGSSIRTFGFKGDILSFEPLPDAHILLQKAAASDEFWKVAERMAIGDSEGEVNINISENSVSSSILPILNSHVEAASESAYVGKIPCHVSTLDSQLEEIIKLGSKYFLKIDTQGFEWAVLDGAKTALDGCVGLVIEMSLVPLYEGQKLWDKIYSRLEDEGFEIWAIQPGFCNKESGQTLQMDIVFIKKKIIELI
jgi:FkbM family methyltransferase